MAPGKVMENRDYSIDCVKVLAVIFVIVHHVVDCGLTMLDTASGILKMIWYFLHSVSLTCVDLFALVTGYLCVTSNGAHKRLLGLWGQVLFIGIAISSAIVLAGGGISSTDWIRSFFPVITGEYWYFTAYVIVCLFMPFVNHGARTLDGRSFARLLLAFFLLLSVSSLFTTNDPFVLKKGYSFAWLLVVYLFGAYWRIHVTKPPSLITCLIIIIVFSFSFLIPSVGKRIFSGELGVWLGNVNPIRYTSPFTLVMSLAVFGICKHIDLKSLWGRRMLVSVSRKSLGMYLWLVHPVFWHSIWRPRLRAIGIGSLCEFIVYVPLITLCSFTSAWLLESARECVFSSVSKMWGKSNQTTGQRVKS